MGDPTPDKGTGFNPDENTLALKFDGVLGVTSGFQCRLRFSNGVASMDRIEATETSPLLRKPSDSSTDADRHPNGVSENLVGVNGHQSGNTKRADDEESHTNSEQRAAQYEGMPEVKAKLAYILPALSIGVIDP